MCKYCKRLKQLKDLDEKRYKEIISAWRSRDKQGRDLVSSLYSMLIAGGENTRWIHQQVVDFLNVNWIGK